MMSLGKRILLLRKKRGWSQAQLADALGTTRQAVSKWESEKSLPDIELAVKMGALFQVSMDYLLLGEEAGSGEMPPAGESRRDHRLLFGLILGLSVLLLMLLPVLASMYCVLMGEIGPVYTDPQQYLQEWPLAGFKWLGVIGFLFGAGGLMWKYVQTKMN